MEIKKAKLEEILMKVNLGLMRASLTLTRASLGLTGTESLPIGSLFSFEDGAISWFDGDIRICAPLPKDLENIRGAVQGGIFRDMVSQFPEELISFSLNDQQQEIILKGESIEMGIRLQKFRDEYADSLGLLSLHKRRDIWKRLPIDFQRILEISSISTSRDLAGFSFGMIFFEKTEVFSTDKMRATRWTLDKKMDDAFAIQVKTAAILSAFNPVFYYNKGEQIHFKDKDNAVFSMRLNKEPIPAHFREIGKIMNGPKVPISIPKDFIDSLRRSQILIIEDKTDYSSNYISIQIRKEGTFTVSSKSREGHWIKETYNHRGRYSLEFQINPYVLKEVLGFSESVFLMKDQPILLLKAKNFDYILSLKKNE